MLELDPPPGVAAWPVGDSLTDLEAQICGPVDSPYENGVFKLKIRVPDRYPFEPPKLVFVTPIYHPNIDSGGRICLDTLNMPPKGAWKPSLNLLTVLTSIHLLLSNPNPDDGLMADITHEYKTDKQTFLSKARNHTKRYAVQSTELSPTDMLPTPSGTGEVCPLPQFEPSTGLGSINTAASSSKASSSNITKSTTKMAPVEVQQVNESKSETVSGATSVAIQRPIDGTGGSDEETSSSEDEDGDQGSFSLRSKRALPHGSSVNELDIKQSKLDI